MRPDVVVQKNQARHLRKDIFDAKTLSGFACIFESRMNEELTDKAEKIFYSALKTGTPEQRNNLLERECGGDAALRLLVEELLAVQPEMNRFFKSFQYKM